MKQTNALRRAFTPVLAMMFLVLTVFGVNQVEAASNYTVTFTQSGGTSTTYYRDPSFSLEKSASWITISTSSPSAFAIKASSNSTGKGRIGYVYVKRQGSVVTTYTIIQQGSTNLSVGIAKGSTSTYGKNSNQSISVSGSWITIYRPNDYNFRIDYSANTTGSTRTGYVYVKEGSTTFTTYKITQSSSVTVTYDKNGGSGSNYTRSIAYGSNYGKVDNPTRTGYNFAGWFTAKSGGSQVTETTKMQQTANHTLYARWSPKTFTVSFNSQGGSTVSSKTVTYDGTYGSLSSPTKSGYTFAGWFTAASGGTQVTSSTKVAITANQVLYAHWTAKSYTLSFNSQGGSSVSSKTVTYGSKYGTLSSPTKTGYTFAGWYTAASGGSQVTSSTTVSTASNHTVYAHWTANTYTVTYDKNGGSGSNYTRSIAYGSKYGKTDNPTRTGYTFTGWYTAKSGGSQVTETTLMSTANNHTLYARWTPKTFTVSFNSQGGSSVSAKTVTYDSTYGTLSSPTKTGYTFAGWFTAASGGSQVTSSTKVTITANQTLYAHWTLINVTVTYDKNGGSGSNLNRSISYGSNYGKVDAPTRTGYTFKGWYTAKTGGSQITETTKMTSTSNHTLYAQWTAKSYMVSFSSQGGGTVSVKTVTYDSTYGTLATPTYAGYNFAGWFTAASGGSQVTASTKVTITANQTLYAHWTPKTLTISFDSQGGSSVSAKSVTFGGTYGTLPTPTRTNYTFDGWYTAAWGETKITDSTKVTVTANQTLYALWTGKMVTVTYDLNDGSGSKSTRSIEYGKTYGKVGNPTRTGYDFRGWYTSKTYETQVVESTKLTNASNHTLYAKWSPKSYTVTFDSQEGTSDVTSKTVYYDFTYGSLPTPTREYYTFDGWYTDIWRGEKITSGTLVKLSSNQTLYAHWTGKMVTVTYKKNGGDGADYTRTIAYGSKYGKVDNPTRTGYNFLGWYDDPTFYHQVTESTELNRTDDHTLYAKWEEKKFKVSFDSRGGSSVSPKTVIYSYCYGDLDVPKKSGYTFDGWFTKASGGTKVDKNTKITITADQTLYAHWTWVDPATCPHTDYTEQIISSGSCFVNGLKVRRCKLCDTSWEVVIRAPGKHEYDIKKDSPLTVSCKKCGEPKYIGDMSLNEVSYSWEEGGASFERRDIDTQKEILIKWMHAIMEKTDPDLSTADDIRAYVNKLYSGNTKAIVTEESKDWLYDLLDKGQKVTTFTQFVGDIKDLSTIPGYSDLSVYSKAFGTTFFILSLTDPDKTWDIKGAEVIAQVLPITGTILEGTLQAGRAAINLARYGVVNQLEEVTINEAIEKLYPMYDYYTISLTYIKGYESIDDLPDDVDKEYIKKYLGVKDDDWVPVLDIMKAYIANPANEFGFDSKSIDDMLRMFVNKAIQRKYDEIVKDLKK